MRKRLLLNQQTSYINNWFILLMENLKSNQYKYGNISQSRKLEQFILRIIDLLIILVISLKNTTLS